MRKPRRLVVALAVSALVAAGGAATALAASASSGVAATCNGTASPQQWTICQINSQDIGTLSSLSLVVTLKSGDGQDDQYIGVYWQGFCGPNGSVSATANITSPTNPPPKTPISTNDAPLTISIPLPYTDPRYCEISATATLWASLGGGTYTEATTGSYQMQMKYAPWPQPSASPSPPASVPLTKGYGGKCLDDKANSSANRTEVIQWTCNSADPSQGWKFTNGELVHNGKCANDRGNGASGTKVILWTCTHAPDETWTHTGNDGEFVLGSKSHGQLCLTDPGHSTTNRTQLIVYTCRNTSNQHWT
jgi:hypothetical protein